MADDKLIGQLDSANALTGNEVVPLSQGGVVRGANTSQFYQLFLSLINSDSIPEGAANKYFTNDKADSRVALHANRTDNPHNVTAAQLGISNTASLKGNLSANTNPTTTDDASKGYAVGSLWINTLSNSVFTCVSATNGGALWVDTTNNDINKQTIGLGNVENTALSQWAGSTNLTTVADVAVTAKTSSINHDQLLNFVANKHIDHSTVSIMTGANSGLTGGGDITSNRSLKIDPSTLSTLPANQVDAANDLIMAYDVSSATLKTISPNTILQQNTSSNIPVPIRNNLLAASLDTNQKPNFLGITLEQGNQVSVNTGNKPFALTAANGFGVGGSIDPYFYTSTQFLSPVLEGQYQYLYSQFNGSTWVSGSRSVVPQYRRQFNPRPFALLHFDVDFSDAYGNTFTNSGVTLSSSTFKFGTASARFNGSSFISNTSIDQPLSRWEMDFWVNPDSFTSVQTLLHWSGNNSGSGIKLDLDTTGKPVLNLSSNGTAYNLLISTNSFVTLVSTVWSHIRVSFDSQVYRVFVNGVLAISYASPIGVTANSNPWQLKLGSDFSNTSPFTGYLDEFRFGNGFTRAMDGVIPSGSYLEDADWFDIISKTFKHGGPTTGWTVAPTCYFGEAFAGNWNALLRFDGANNSTTFTDTHSHNWRAIGSPIISTSQSQFGGASLLLNGTSDYLQITDATISTKRNAFEIEFWFYSNASANQTLFNWGDNSFGVRLDTTSSGNLTFNVSSNGTSYDVGSSNGPTTISNSTWYNIRIVFTGSAYVLYVNGTQELSYTSSALIPQSNANTITLGALPSGSNFFNGYIDELRISLGYFRTIGNFTNNTSAYANTQFTSVSSIFPYIPMGYFEEEVQPTLQFGSTNTYSHGLGTKNVKFTPKLRCINPEWNYKPGELVDLKTQGFANQAYGFDISVLDSFNYSVSIGTLGLIVIDKATFTPSGVSPANWALVIHCERGF